MVHEPAAAHEPGYDTTNRVFSTIYLDKPWQQIGNFNSILSLTADRKGNVYLSDRERKGILRIDPQGRTTPFAGAPDSGIAQAAPDSGFVLRMGPEDRLYAYIPETKLDHLDRGTIVSWSTANGAASDKKVVASGFDKLDIVNGGPADVIDFTLMQNGTIYALLYMGVVRIDPSGQMSTVLKWDGLLSQMGPAAAIALSPDQSMAVVVGQLTRYGWSFQLTADGSLQNGEPFYRLEMEEALSHASVGVREGQPRRRHRWHGVLPHRARHSSCHAKRPDRGDSESARSRRRPADGDDVRMGRRSKLAIRCAGWQTLPPPGEGDRRECVDGSQAAEADALMRGPREAGDQKAIADCTILPPVT